VSIAKVTEIISTSKKSFEDAIEDGIKRANKTLRNVTSVWVGDQNIKIKDGKEAEYRVRMKITFILDD